ncbi:MAG TPA: hypothetical protein VGG29_16810 [Caulobacteraceae bacterium]|jgi:hypothetical protein
MTTTDSGQTAARRGPALAAALAAAILACAAAGSQVRAAPVDLQVVDRTTGQPLRVWRHDGRSYVAGAVGDRYGLRVTNHTDGRVLVVLSVDGVNIISGETAGYDQRGYIFAPHETYVLNGWRKSLNEIADFTFARLPNSYAALTGRPANVGVIGIAVFNERAQPVAAEQPAPPPDESERAAVDDAAARAMPHNAPPPLAMREAPPPPPAPPPPTAITAYTGPMRDAAAAPERREEKLGTGHGAREWSVMTIEPFERATSYPQYRQEIAYDTRANLVAMGVIPVRRDGERRPRPFPSSGAEPGFVPDPPFDP